MQTPNFSLEQYVSSAVLNSAFAAVSGSLARSVQQTFQPGLLNPDTIGMTSSGLNATLTMSQPFGVVFSGGIMAFAHGSQTGQDSQSATVNFTSLVPPSGSVTAYLVVTSGSIQQGPIGLPGPPAGHPDFNPNFVPTTGYQNNVDTLLLSATTAPPNNLTSFELARTPLAFGATSLTLTAANQVRATPSDAQAQFVVTGSYAITPQAAPFAIVTGTAGLTTTLPPAANSAGLSFYFLNVSAGSWAIAAAGNNVIYGPVASGAVSNFVLLTTQAATLYSNGFAWFAIAGSPVGFTPVQQGGGALQGTNKVYLGWATDTSGPRIQIDSTDIGSVRMMTNWNVQVFQFTGTIVPFTIPPGVTRIKIRAWGGGASGGASSGTGAGGGGGGGAYEEGIFVVTPGASFNVVVGIGGAPVGASSTGNNGGSSSVAGLVNAGGGGGGIGSSSGGSGGGAGGTTSGSGYLSVHGAGGGNGVTYGGTVWAGGFGGGTFCVSNPGPSVGAIGGIGGSSPGGGGNGGSNGGISGAGAPGLIIIEW